MKVSVRWLLFESVRKGIDLSVWNKIFDDLSKGIFLCSPRRGTTYRHNGRGRASKWFRGDSFIHIYLRDKPLEI